MRSAAMKLSRPDLLRLITALHRAIAANESSIQALPEGPVSSADRHNLRAEIRHWKRLNGKLVKSL